jgi:FMN phosphatase YigB (HAD superfamily)
MTESGPDGTPLLHRAHARHRRHLPTTKRVAQHMSTAPAVIVFNIENTLAASFQALVAACRQLCVIAWHPSLRHVDPLSLASAIERNRVWFWSAPERAARAQHDIRTAQGEFVLRAMTQLGLDECMEIADAFAAELFTLQRRLMRLFPHSQQTLRRLNQAGIRYGAIFRRPEEPTQVVLHNPVFRQHFEHVIAGGHGVQATDHLLHRTMDLFDVPAEDLCIISNQLSLDLEPAVQLGLLSIWINLPRSGQRVAAGRQPDHILSNTADLAPLLLRA